MSKSKGTFVKARAYLDAGLDPAYLRYFYAAKLNGQAEDLDLNLDEFKAKIDSDLVGKVVNLASRTAKFVPRLTDAYPDDDGLLAVGAAASERISAAYRDGDYGAAMREIMALADQANEYVERHAPWALKKDPAKAAELADICTVSLNLFRQLCVYLAPVLPDLAAKAGSLLNAPIVSWADAQRQVTGNSISPFSHLAERVDPDKVKAMITASAVPEETPNAERRTPNADGALLAANPLAPTIAFEDFAKLDLRVALVVAAEEVPKAKKIVKLTLSLGGDDRRTVFAGIKSAYGDPAKLVGRLIVVVANLAPKQMSFGLSEGMALAAGPGGSDIFLLSPDSGAKPGMRVS
jgi:methionyl-tRNA synthetase